MTWFDDVPDDIYLDQFTVHNDGDGYDLVAQVPGPAGTADVELGGGITVWVDFVEPTQPTSLAVEGTQVPFMLERFIGEDRTELLGGHLQSGGRRARRLQRETDDVGRRRGFGTQPSLNRIPTSREAQTLGAVAVLRSMGEDDQFDDVTRAMALLESVRFQDDDLDPALEIDASVADTIERAADLLEGRDEELRTLVARDRFLAEQLSKELVRFARGHEPIERASRLLSSPPEHLSRDAVLAEREAARSADQSPTAVGLREPVLELSPGGLLTAHLDATEVGKWMRVVDRGPMVLLALVPVLPDDGAGIAHAVLGAGFTTDQLDLEVTDRPLPPPTATVDLIAHAVALGRRASSTMSVDVQAANDTWQECADVWRALGDERRARLARRYAREGRRVWRQPFWAERVHAALHSVAYS